MGIKKKQLDRKFAHVLMCLEACPHLERSSSFIFKTWPGPGAKMAKKNIFLFVFRNRFLRLLEAGNCIFWVLHGAKHFSLQAKIKNGRPKAYSHELQKMSKILTKMTKFLHTQETFPRNPIATNSSFGSSNLWLGPRLEMFCLAAKIQSQSL